MNLIFSKLARHNVFSSTYPYNQASFRFISMFSNFKIAFTSSTKPERAPRGTQVRGDYKELIPRVQNDINIITTQLAQYENKSLLRKIIQLMKKNHKEQIEELKREHGGTPKHDVKLFHLLKTQLAELGNLLDIFKNNFIHSLYDNHLLDYKMQKLESSSGSKLSSASSGSSVSLLSMGEVDDNVVDDAPDYLLDPISFEILTDPVVTPSGITYEKEEILNHINSKGKYDPISKQPLSKDQLYPNLIIKDTVEAYKVEHSK
ncbi:hypothetical protein CORT_0E03180 [Candida orthopsilosis Co 90-125]|uniref:RING-type E3 ubiquitin transferase n=1 Tax=Candida orthopsilosis (strain 90-125) TaxID=1136231 RepID=H8X6X9_CANO9|nr:hypothetical protein CORT_0E03180 [Candida orthopsilosis Co 90-125]CCG23907.1 hypothetical protein CORT_0E03180 [Candida orthopsilosis Co 90-125]